MPIVSPRRRRRCGRAPAAFAPARSPRASRRAAASSWVSFTDSRYESVATMRSSLPLAVTSTPVRCGRVSSREAARATRAIVSTNAVAGTRHAALAGRLGQLREVLGRQRAQVELRRSRHHLDVLLRAAVLERELDPSAANERRRAAAGRGSPPGPGDDSVGSSATRTPSSMSVASSSARPSSTFEQDARQRLDRAARGRPAHGDAELGEERFTGNGELQVLLPDLEVVGAVDTSTGARIRLGIREVRTVDCVIRHRPSRGAAETPAQVVDRAAHSRVGVARRR